MKHPTSFVLTVALKILAITAFFWLSKGASFYLALHSLNIAIQLVLCAIIIFFGALALNGFMSIFVLAKSRGFTSTRAFWLVLLSYFISELPFAADMISLLYGINQTWWPAAFVVLAVSVLSLLFVVRLPALLLLVSFEKKLGTQLSKRVFTHLVALVVVYLCEVLLLGLIPFVYATSFGVPMLFREESGSSLQSAEQLVVLVNPQISDNKRNALMTSGFSGLNEIAEAIAQSKNDDGSFRRITYVFPETALFATQHQVLQLLNLISAQKPDANVSLVIGVREGSQNIVYGAKRSENNDVSVWPIQVKSDLVPLVEGTFAGFYLGDENSQTKASVSETATNWNALKTFPADSKLLICYESLQPKKIVSEGPAIVLTNHSSFSRWTITSQAYDTALRTLYRLTGRALILVGNFGVSGAFLNGHNDFVGTAFRVQLLGLSQIRQQ